jgi:hypothetical protein
LTTRTELKERGDLPVLVSFVGNSGRSKGLTSVERKPERNGIDNSEKVRNSVLKLLIL